MNYYIQGDAAKADQIKAAWEKLGIKVSGYDFSRKDVLFFTFEAKGKSYMMSAVMGTGLDNIILTHPDYQELPLPKPHYDIANFKPFDKVLVRCSNDEEWMIEFYCKYDTLVHTSPHRDCPFMGIGDSYSQCIPFEGNEHLLGTNDMPSEEYINW